MVGAVISQTILWNVPHFLTPLIIMAEKKFASLLIMVKVSLTSYNGQNGGITRFIILAKISPLPTPIIVNAICSL